MKLRYVFVGLVAVLLVLEALFLLGAFSRESKDRASRSAGAGEAEAERRRLGAEISDENGAAADAEEQAPEEGAAAQAPEFSMSTPSAHSVVVRVRDHRGEPLEARVEIRLGNVTRHSFGTLLTDASGSVRAYLPGPDGYLVIADVDGTQLERSFLVSDERPHATVEIAYPGGASITGRVFSGHGGLDRDVRSVYKALGEEELTVELIRVDGKEPRTLSSIVDASGTYSVEGLAAGEHFLLIRSKFHAEKVALAVGEHLVHDIQLANGAISGRAIEEWTGKPATRVQVVIQLVSSTESTLRWIKEAGFPRVSDRLLPDENGAYAFSNLPDGEYSMFSNGAGYGVLRKRTTIDSGHRRQTVDFELKQGAAIFLTVQDLNGNDLAPFFCMTKGITWGFGGRVQGFDAGKQDFVCFSPGHEIQIKPQVELKPGDPNEIAFRLAPAARTRLKFVDALKQPIRDVRVSVPHGTYDLQELTEAFRRRDPTPFRVTGADGAVVVAVVKAGPCRVVAKKSGFAILDRTIELAAERPEQILEMVPGETRFRMCVRVGGVSPGGQADRLGVEVGDFITTYGGSAISSRADLTEAMEAAAATGGEVEMVIESGGSERRLQVRPGVIGVSLEEIEEER
jgi:hypothetical protein